MSARDYTVTPDREFIPIDECEHGRAYVLKSRNLNYGVYNEATKGFVGIREKFNELYLFTEFHYDTGAPFGTARPITPGPRCPITDLREGWSTGLCRQHDRATEWRPDNPPAETPGWRYHIHDGSRLAWNDFPTHQTNRPLFDWLTPETDRLAAQYAAQRERYDQADELRRQEENDAMTIDHEHTYDVWVYGKDDVGDLGPTGYAFAAQVIPTDGDVIVHELGTGHWSIYPESDDILGPDGEFELLP